MENFHQKYELKVGYADFLLKQLLSSETDGLSAYGCLACFSKFSPHITKKIILEQVPKIAELFKAKGVNDELATINLSYLQTICLQLLEYIQTNEVSNTETMARVSDIITQTFQNDTLTQNRLDVQKMNKDNSLC